MTPGNGEGKEPEVGEDTVSRAEGRLRCMTGFREVSEQPRKNAFGSSIPGIFLEAVDTRPSHLGHPGAGNPGSDHLLVVRRENSKIAAPQSLGDLGWGTVL